MEAVAAAKAVLERVERESTGIFSGVWAHRSRASRRDDEATPQDGIERLGRRIGRILGWIAALCLLANLFTHWFF